MEATKAQLTVTDKRTGEVVDDAVFEVRKHGTNYQASIQWRAIVAIAYGDSMDEAASNVFDKFTGKKPLEHYVVSLPPSAHHAPQD